MERWQIPGVPLPGEQGGRGLLAGSVGASKRGLGGRDDPVERVRQKTREGESVGTCWIHILEGAEGSGAEWGWECGQHVS